MSFAEERREFEGLLHAIVLFLEEPKGVMGHDTDLRVDDVVGLVPPLLPIDLHLPHKVVLSQVFLILDRLLGQLLHFLLLVGLAFIDQDVQVVIHPPLQV